MKYFSISILLTPQLSRFIVTLQGEYDEAGRLFERSLAIREKALGPEHPDVAASFNNRAAVLESQVRAIRIPGCFMGFVFVGESLLFLVDHCLTSKHYFFRKASTTKPGRCINALLPSA